MARTQDEEDRAIAAAIAESLVLARMSSELSVDQHAGQEMQMYHCTDIAAAKTIVQSQSFRPSTRGCLGVGVYLTRDRKKAEGYREPRATAPAPGPMLMCRVKLGVCITLRDQRDGTVDPLAKTWCGSGC